MLLIFPNMTIAQIDKYLCCIVSTAFFMWVMLLEATLCLFPTSKCVSLRGLLGSIHISEPPYYMSEHGLIHISCANLMMQMDYISAEVTLELHA